MAEATVEATAESATEAVMVWSMEVGSIWRAETAMLTTQGKTMEGDGWFSEAV